MRLRLPEVDVRLRQVHQHDGRDREGRADAVLVAGHRRSGSVAERLLVAVEQVADARDPLESGEANFAIDSIHFCQIKELLQFHSILRNPFCYSITSKS